MIPALEFPDTTGLEFVYPLALPVLGFFEADAGICFKLKLL
jgi:hypothetical protein